MYADFESLLVKPPEEGIGTNFAHPPGLVNVHEPSGWCVKSEFAPGKVSNLITSYRGKDCIEKFCAHIASKAKRLYGSYPEVMMVPLSPKQIAAHSNARVCHICLRSFREEDRKVTDHCHYTGKYRDVAHSKCNLEYKIPDHIPVIFHNLSGYNAHLFIRELGKHTGRTSVIAKNNED